MMSFVEKNSNTKIWSILAKQQGYIYTLGVLAIMTMSKTFPQIALITTYIYM